MTAKPNSEAFERDLIISDNGFREYDVRWLYPDQINLRGVMALGQALGTFMHESGITPPNIVVGHDYRSYSATIKHALMLGLVTAECHVKDMWSGLIAGGVFRAVRAGLSGGSHGNGQPQ